jgi:hypothetical protein
MTIFCEALDTFEAAVRAVDRMEQRPGSCTKKEAQQLRQRYFAEREYLLDVLGDPESLGDGEEE